MTACTVGTVSRLFAGFRRSVTVCRLDFVDTVGSARESYRVAAAWSVSTLTGRYGRAVDDRLRHVGGDDVALGVEENVFTRKAEAANSGSELERRANR